MRTAKPFRLDAETLSRAGVSGPLAIHGDLWGSFLTLAADEPSSPTAIASEGVTVVEMSIEGPLEQRATAWLCGVSDGYDAIAARFAEALEQADGVLLRIDSPGGVVAGLEEAVEQMRAAKAASGVPVVAFVDELAASAAYWIASSVADEIVLPTAGRVGSVGVLAARVDETKALEQEGIGVTIHREPAGKAAAHPAGPVADVADDRISRLVGEAATRFYSAVGEARGLSPDTVRGFDAEVFSGQAAIDAGLADRVGGYASALELAAALAAERKGVMEANQIRAALELHDDADISDVVETAKAIKLERDEALERAQKAEQKAAELERQLDEQTATFDAIERRRLGARLVTEAGFPPAVVWGDPDADDDEALELAAGYKEMSTESLRAHVEKAVANPIVRQAAPSEPIPGDATPREVSMCQAQGIDLTEYLETKRRFLARRSAIK